MRSTQICEPPKRSAKAAQLRATLGARAFDAVYGVFQDAHARCTSVEKRLLVEIVGSQDKYDLCLQVESIVFAEMAQC